MYDFFYNVIQNKYGHQNVKLLMTDTDSLILEIATDDVYKDIYDDKNLKSYFDFSDYPQPNNDNLMQYNRLLHSNENKKVIGKFKDETISPIVEFNGLAAKMYSLITADNHEKKTAKGVSSWVVKRDLKFENYRKCLANEKVEKDDVTYSHKMMTIKSYKHQLYTVEQKKKTLTCYCNKRYLLNDGITSVPYGHYSIK